MRGKVFFKGLKDSVPIALGYFAVAITIGIAAANAGLGLFQSWLLSALSLSSTGDFAGIGLIAASGTYIEMALMQLVINARYILMSASLSQKLKSSSTLPERLLVSMGITDEIFGLSIAVDGALDPYYTIGIICLAIPGWSFGTVVGAFLGNILPEIIVNALGVSLYGMFISVFIPPAKNNRVIAAIVVLSFILSTALTYLPKPWLISEGTKIIILTVIISVIAALLFPVDIEEEEHEE